MKQFVVCIILLLSTVFIENNLNAKENFPVLKGPYLGQKPPGDEPQLFMPGLVSTHDLDICITFLQKGKVCVFSNNENIIYFTYEKDGQWIKPEKAPFPDKKGKTQYTAGPDGQTLYFHSSRPTYPEDKRRDLNTWTVKWTGSGWTEPYPLPAPANTDEYHEIYPSMTSNRTLYYFSGWRKDAPLGDSYRSRFVNGRYQQAEKMEYPINSEYHEGDPFVAPDESFLIFASNRPGGFGFMDLYISFRRDDDSWTHPINLGQKINSHLHVNTVCVTLDHKYFFFSSSRSTDIPKGKIITSSLHDRVGDIDLYWVKTGFIKDLKRIALSKKQAAQIIDNEYQENGLQSAIKKLKELYSSGKDIYHFSLSELLITCGHMIKMGKVNDADKFYKALLKILPDKFRIKQGYATVNILNGLTAKGTNLLKKVWSEYPSAKSLKALEPIYSHLRFTEKMKDELTLLRFTTDEFPNSYLAFYDLASLFDRTADIELAINNCKKSLELKPDFDDARKLLDKLVNKHKEEDFPVLKGPYLGQKPPGMVPEIFAPGIITSDKSDGCSGFGLNGDFFLFQKFFNKKSYTYETVQKKGIWSIPRLLPFSEKYQAGDFTIAADGKTIHFASRIPLPGLEKDAEGKNIYFSRKNKNGWTEPEQIGFIINTKWHESYPSVAKNGNLYFFGRIPGGFGKSDLYMSKFVNEKYEKPKNMGENFNTSEHEWDPYIAPDESYIIYCSTKSDSYGEDDFYISFKKNNTSWTKPVNMGNKINSSFSENRPYVTLDGKYFFFTSNKSGNRDIYWVNAKIIEKFKPDELK